MSKKWRLDNKSTGGNERSTGDNDRSAGSAEPIQEGGFILGRYVAGDFALKVWAGLVICYLDALRRHLVILGKTGKGKTTTARIILEGVARLYGDAQIFFIDGNNDPAMARLFGSVLTALGRSPRFFPRERFNAWPADSWIAIRNRTKEIIPFSRQGDGAFYTSKGSVILFYACRLDGTPPKSLTDLMSRVNYGRIVAGFGPNVLRGITREDVDHVYMRVKEIYTDVGSSLDGKWSYGDVDSAYFALNSLAFGQESAVVTMRLLLSQLSYYIEHEKDPDRPCVVIIDEFASFAGGVEMGMFIEHARKLGVIVIVMSQTVAGMGKPEQRARILHNPELVLCHTTPEWHEVKELISLQTVPEMTLRHGNAIGEPDLRLVERAKVTTLLDLDIGEAWLFSDAKAMRLRMMYPGTSGLAEFDLPEPEDIFEDLDYSSDIVDASPDEDLASGPEPTSWLEDRADHQGPDGGRGASPLGIEIPAHLLAAQKEAEQERGAPVEHADSEVPPEALSGGGGAAEDFPDELEAVEAPPEPLTPEPEDVGADDEVDETEVMPETPDPDDQGDGAAEEIDAPDTGSDEVSDDVLAPEEDGISPGGQPSSVGGGLLGAEVPAELLAPRKEDDWADGGVGNDWADDRTGEEEERLDEMSDAYLAQIERLRSSEQEGAHDEDERT